MSGSLEKRVAVLEQQMARSQAKATGREWLEDLYGKFAGDPIFARAMKLGAQYRQSLRPHRERNGSRRRPMG